MIWHPISLAVLALDALALIFFASASVTWLRVLLRWAPEQADPHQIALEAATDGASLATRYGLVFFVASSLALVLGIVQVFPGLVPGAMCGTGVLSAMKGEGARALALRGLALAALWAWRSLDGVNRAHPRPPSVPLVARWHLLAFPLFALSVLATLRALLALDPHVPVDCCQVVYDNFSSPAEAHQSFGLSDSAWLWLTGLGAAALAGLALGAWGRIQSEGGRAGRRAPRGWLLLTVTFIWLPVAALTLVRVLAAVHYEVLHHHCPWCLFLPEHGAVGYPLFGALIVIGLEAIAFVAAGQAAHAAPTLRVVARERQGRALKLMLMALVVFLGLSFVPAFLWRLAHGVWMHGA